MFRVDGCLRRTLDDALAAVDLESATASALWQRYLRVWTPWNHVRTLGSIAACARFVAALRQR